MQRHKALHTLLPRYLAVTLADIVFNGINGIVVLRFNNEHQFTQSTLVYSKLKTCQADVYNVSGCLAHISCSVGPWKLSRLHTQRHSAAAEPRHDPHHS